MANLLSLEQLKQAVEVKQRIAELENRLVGILSGTTSAPTSVTTQAGHGGRRVMSPESRARIVTAHKARWAKFHAAKKTAAPKKEAGQKRRVYTPEAKARMVAAVKARWARERAKKGR